MKRKFLNAYRALQNNKICIDEYIDIIDMLQTTCFVNDINFTYKNM